MASVEHIFEEIGGFHVFQLIMIAWVYSIKFMVSFDTSSSMSVIIECGDFFLCDFGIVDLLCCCCHWCWWCFFVVFFSVAVNVVGCGNSIAVIVAVVVGVFC